MHYLSRNSLPIPHREHVGDDLRRQGPRYLVSADRAAAAAGGCPERGRHHDRRRRVRVLFGLRRPVQTPVADHLAAAGCDSTDSTRPRSARLRASPSLTAGTIML